MTICKNAVFFINFIETLLNNGSTSYSQDIWLRSPPHPHTAGFIPVQKCTTMFLVYFNGLNSGRSKYRSPTYLYRHSAAV